MSIYHTVSDHLDAYIESLNGEPSTLDESLRWVSRELYHHDESIRMLGAITMHNLALDRGCTRSKAGGSANIERERADFETWCYTRSLDTGRDVNGDYISLETYLSWEAWQAGRAALHPDSANRLRKTLAEPVKRKRPYAQGTALGEFGVIPMCDQVDDESVKVPPGYVLIAEKYLEEIIGPERMEHFSSHILRTR